MSYISIKDLLLYVQDRYVIHRKFGVPEILNITLTKRVTSDIIVRWPIENFKNFISTLG